MLHVSNATYEQLPDDRTVRVRGATFSRVRDGEYTLKLEAARVRGYHSAFFGGLRDPILIAQIDDFFTQVKQYVKDNIGFDHELELAAYGKDAIMGPLEPDNVSVPKEICICAHARAETQQQATHVISVARVACVHGPYPHQVATAGNMAMPFAPFDIPLGLLTEFCMYHVVKAVDPLIFFPIRQHLVPGQNGVDSHSALVTSTPRTKKSSKVLKSSVVNHPGPNHTTTKQSFLHPSLAPGSTYLGDLASVVRSKNAGPYEMTFDVMFDTREVYENVKQTGVLCEEMIARLYQIPPEDVIACLFWDPAKAFKATIKRPAISGSFGSLDVHGSCQHIPLLYTVLPIPSLKVNAS